MSSPAITLGERSAASPTGPLTYWNGGSALIWVGSNSNYDFGGGTLTIEVSDTNDTAGARALKVNGVAVSKTAIDLIQIFLPPAWYRSILTGATLGGVEVEIKPAR